MIKKINLILVLNILTIILIIILPYYLFGGKLYLGGDDTKLFYTYPSLYLKNIAGFSWFNLSSIGINASSQFLIPFLFLWSIIDKVFNNKIFISYSAFSLPLLMGLIFFQKFTKELFNLTNEHRIQLYIGSIFYIFSPILLIDQLFIFLTPVWLIGVFPALGFLFLKYLRTHEFKYIYFAMIFCLLFSFCFIAIPWIAGIILPFAIGLVVLSLFTKKQEFINFFKRGFIFLIFVAASQAYWLISFFLPYILVDRTSYASKFVSVDFLQSFYSTVLATAVGSIYYPLIGLFHRQIAFSFDWKLKNEFIHFYDKTYPLNLIYIFIIAVGIFSFRKYLNKDERRKYIFILTSFIFSLYFLTVNIGPLRELFLLFGRIPGFVMFRNFYDKFAPGYVLIYSILITISLVIIRKRFPSKYKLIYILIFFIILLNFSVAKSTITSPLWTTKSVYKTINIPNEYLDFTKQISEKVPSTNTILTLPFGSSVYGVIKDQNSDNVYVGVSPVKIFSGVNDISGSMSFNFTDEVYSIDKIIIDRKYDQLNKILYGYNVNYIMKTKNIPDQVLNSYVYYRQTLAMQDQNFLNSIKGKRILVSSQGNYELYTTKQKNSIINSSDSFFEKINPVSYKVYIKNLNGPRDIKFNDSFHSGWKLFLVKDPSLNFCDTRSVISVNNTNECKINFKYFDPTEMSYMWEKSVFNQSHRTTNGYSNSWTIDPKFVMDNFDSRYYKINKDGSIDVELNLYFKPQVYFYYGVIISVIVFILSTIYMIYLGFKKRHEK